ncbi:hypothetical protein QZN01_20900 [Burkholderia cenocepacia]|uniref:hypothetical protein n=1 Tax=Burkholderia cenocepacia TaxID=95486 RepID=UPI00265304BB|nr:hypothetical protein [Burkholderia cenocepacia]MDN7825114.1 hypothetical protein [Burkholderia cenocepacia]
MKRFAICAAVLAVLAIIVASCSDRPTVVTHALQPAAPVVVQQSNDGFWQGVLLGHFFSSSPSVVHHYDSRPAYVAPRAIVQNTTIVNKTVVQSASRPVAPAMRPSTPAARTVVPSVSTPRPSPYSGSYSSRSSYSSFSSGRR